MDKRAPGVLRKKKNKKKTKKKKKNSNNNAQSKFNERHVRNASHKRCQVANSQCTRIGTLCIANRASRLSCNLCAISYDRSRFILSPAPQRNATVLFSTRSPRLQTVTGVRLSRYSCLVIPEGRPTIRQNTARLV